MLAVAVDLDAIAGETGLDRTFDVVGSGHQWRSL
jgi:hypothetical protein